MYDHGNGTSLVELVDLSGGTVPPQTFGATLRAARLSRNVSLDAIAAHTKINRAFFQDLERNDLSKWPASQFYRESYVRAYAEAIGLNPREVIDGFRREIAVVDASNVAAPNSRPRRLTPVTIPIILAVTFVVAYALARWLAPASQAPAAAVSEPATPAAENSAPANANAPAATPPATTQLSAVAPVQAAEVEGELVITSTPSGARVVVNGIGRGRTPARVPYLAPGTYTVRLVQPGYKSLTRRATIAPGRLKVEVSATLEPVTPEPEPEPEPAPAQEATQAPAPAPAPAVEAPSAPPPPAEAPPAEAPPPTPAPAQEPPD